MSQSDNIEVKAEGWNHYIRRHISLRWPSPHRSWFPEGGVATEMLDGHWLFFQFVFPLRDPRDFPTLTEATFADSERRRLRRYVAHARDLADARALSTQSAYTVSIPMPGSPWQIEERDTVARDVTVGFLVMVRQCYSPDENASFKRVYDIVSREAFKAGVDRDTMRSWKGAHNRMRGQHLDYLILVRAAELEIIRKGTAENSGWSPRRARYSPPDLLLNVLYGEAIHWGDRRAVIEAWDEEHEFWAMKRRWDALRTAVQLGHFYVGFAAVVARALGDVDPVEI